MRVTFAVTMVLFLAPAVYVVKYYAVDLPRETALIHPREMRWRMDPHNPDALLAEAHTARLEEVKSFDPEQAGRMEAIHAIGETLRRPGVNWKRPLECLMAKATLADLAAKNPDPTVRAAAAAELGKVAQGGAVIRR